MEGQAPGGRLTLSLFASTERKRERSPRRLSPTFSSRAPRKTKMFACAKLACTPALVRSHAGPLTQGPRLLACSVHVVGWATCGLGTHSFWEQLSPCSLTRCPYLCNFGRLRSLLPSSRAKEISQGLAVRPVWCRSNPPCPAFPSFHFRNLFWSGVDVKVGVWGEW